MKTATMARLILVLAMGACSGTSSSGTDGGNNPGSDSGTGTNGDMAVGKRGTGVVAANSQTFMAGTSTFKSSSLSAYFANPVAAGGSGCTETTMGVCKITKCTTGTANPDAGTPTYPHAGPISVTGGTKTAMIMPGTSGTYSVYSDNTNTLWNGGEMLTFAATGNANGVPAFSGVVAGPNAIKLTMPTAPAAGTKLMVNRAADLKLVWTGGAGGNAQAIMSQSAGGNSTSIQCTFAAADGMGTVPTAVLTNLTAGDGSASLYASNSKVVTAGNYDVTITAQLPGTGSTNSLAVFTATFQ